MSAQWKCERISQHQLDLGEGPHWDAKTGKLYFTDIENGTIHQYDPESREHTFATVGSKRVSIIIPVENKANEFVVTYGCDIATVEWDGVSTTASNLKILATVDDRYPKVRINDGKTSPSGVLFAGTMWHEFSGYSDMPTAGNFYVLQGNTVKTLINNVRLSNGLAWSRDEKTLYYIDSMLFRVDAFDYDKENITLSNRRTIFDFQAKNINGIPDGMTIDTDGNLWVANFGGSQVLKINPSSGDILDKIKIPCTYVTSVAFGGPNLEDLYVTSAKNVSENFSAKTDPNAGITFKITGTGSQGFPGTSVKL